MVGNAVQNNVFKAWNAKIGWIYGWLEMPIVYQ
jgi:hypothetical protein